MLNFPSSSAIRPSACCSCACACVNFQPKKPPRPTPINASTRAINANGLDDDGTARTGGGVAVELEAGRDGRGSAAVGRRPVRSRSGTLAREEERVGSLRSIMWDYTEIKKGIRVGGTHS